MRKTMLGPLSGGIESALRHAIGDESTFVEENGSSGTPHYVKRSRPPNGGSPLNPNSKSVPRPTTKPACLSYSDWISDALGRKGGVVAGVPAGEKRAARCVVLDSRVASGNALFWAVNLLENQGLFSESRCCVGGSGAQASAVTLQDGLPGFFPEGDVYGVGRSEMDALVDAGFTVDVKEEPYAQRSGVFFEKEEQRAAACAKELSVLLLMAEAGVAPCVLAAFYARRVPAQLATEWQKYKKPTQIAGAGGESGAGRIDALVTVSQVSTFSLGDLMIASQAGTAAKREHASGVLRAAVPLVMKQLRALSAVRGGHGVVKADLTAESVVFCADLQPSEDSWTLGGVGHRPVSREHVDGVPRIKGFPVLLCRRVREAQHDADTATVLHSLLLLGFSEAVHGAEAAAVLREHFAAEGSEFQQAAAAAEKKGGRAAAFLEAVANNADVELIPELQEAMLELETQTSAVVQTGGRELPRGGLFPRLVSFVTFSVGGGGACEEDAAEDAEVLNALEGVKRARDARVLA